jgi:hypothetical protein
MAKDKNKLMIKDEEEKIKLFTPKEKPERKNIFGNPVPYNACQAPLDDELECEWGWSFDCCPYLDFYEEGKWDGHSKCKNPERWL